MHKSKELVIKTSTKTRKNILNNYYNQISKQLYYDKR